MSYFHHNAEFSELEESGTVVSEVRVKVLQAPFSAGQINRVCT